MTSCQYGCQTMAVADGALFELLNACNEYQAHYFASGCVILGKSGLLNVPLSLHCVVS